MRNLSGEGRDIARAAADRHGFGAGAAEEMLRALASGGGGQAQFSHPDFGGMGQWSRGGMLMIGDMFNNGLKARVDALANDLADKLGGVDVFAAEASDARGARAGRGGDWPAEFGAPATSGAQNDMRYAFFPGTRRLAIARGGVTEVYDSGDNVITGVSQAQGGGQTLTFSTAEGLLRLDALRRVDTGDGNARKADTSAPAADRPSAAGSDDAARRPAPSSSGGGNSDVLATLERLAEMRERGILTDEEFAAKKTDLLARI